MLMSGYDMSKMWKEVLEDICPSVMVSLGNFFEKNIFCEMVMGGWCNDTSR